MIRAHLLQSTTVSTNNNTLQMQWQTVTYKFLISVLHYVTLVLTLHMHNYSNANYQCSLLTLLPGALLDYTTLKEWMLSKSLKL